MGREVVPMSTRCQIEFRNGDVRRTVYRHSDGYPSAVIEDLLAFLAWSVRGSDVEYVAANFLYWSKREITKCLPRHEQLGFGICGNDELHGDIEYYYVVAWEKQGVRITAHAIAHDAGEVRLGRVVRSAVYTPPAREEEAPSATFFNSAAATGAMDGVRALPRVQLNGVWYFRDDRLREFRRCDNPHERITFDELLDAA
jgi:hypothetical protein